MTGEHPLAEVFRSAALGRFPPADGRVEVVPPASRFVDAIIAFTARNYIAADIDPAWVQAVVAPDPIAIPLSTRFAHELGAKLGAKPRTGLVDAVFAHAGRSGRPEIGLVEVPPDYEHPRAALSRGFREDVRVFVTADEAGVLILGRGLAGRLEVAFEVEPMHRGQGLGRRILDAGLCIAGDREPLFAQVAPGNAASVRAVLACGFRPIGAELLFARQH